MPFGQMNKLLYICKMKGEQYSINFIEFLEQLL